MTRAVAFSTLYRYSFARCQISSSVALTGLTPRAAPTGPDDIAIEFAEGPCSPIAVTEWRHHWQSGTSAPSLSLARVRNEWLLRVPDLADFIISPDFGSVRVQPLIALDGSTIAHLLLDQVIPRILGQRSELMLHASAVQIGEGGVAMFVGESGIGKSTWAATLYRMGHTVLSDDCVLLRSDKISTTALPTYPSLRLLSDALDHFSMGAVGAEPMAHYSAKKRVPLPSARWDDAGSRVAALFLLERNSGDSSGYIRPVSPRHAFIELARNTFRLDANDARRAADLMPGIASVAERVPAFAVRSPRGLSALREFAEAVVIPRTR